MAIEQTSPSRLVSPPADAAVIKRSIAIAGHRTSVSLEEAFWRELKSLAKRQGRSVSALVAAVDADRRTANLSSAIRVFILQALAERQ
jgi:predicted DNA-binding ribbon-helix-helix protein